MIKTGEKSYICRNDEKFSGGNSVQIFTEPNKDQEITITFQVNSNY